MYLFWNKSPREQFKIAKENPWDTIIGVAIGFIITGLLFKLHALAYVNVLNG